MARISNSQRLLVIHAEAMAQFDRIQTALKDERQQCLQDRRFYSIAGAQWEGPIGEQMRGQHGLGGTKLVQGETDHGGRGDHRGDHRLRLEPPILVTA